MEQIEEKPWPVERQAKAEQMGENLTERRVLLYHPINHTSISALDLVANRAATLNMRGESKATVGQQYFAIVAGDGYLFICGGTTQGRACATAYRAVFSTQTFEMRANMLHPRCCLSLIYALGYVYAIGGAKKYQNDIYCSCERHNVAQNCWTEIPSLNQARCHAAVVLMNQSKIYTIAGWANTNLNSIELLDLLEEAAGWTVLPVQGEILRQYIENNAMAISNTEFIIFGGWDPLLDLSSAFNVQLSTLRSTQRLAKAEYFYTYYCIPTLYRGRVYAVGTQSALHIYSIIRQRWSVIPNVLPLVPEHVCKSALYHTT